MNRMEGNKEYVNITNDMDGTHNTMATASLDKKKTKMKSNSYGTMVVSSLSLLKQNDELCDFTVAARGKALKVHKVLLAATSDYFRAMLCTPMKETQEDCVDLKGLTADSLQFIIDFIYSGEMELDPDNLTEVLNACSFLQVKSGLELCADYMISLITFTNAEGLLNIADVYSLQQVTQYYKNKVLHNFEKFSQTEQFLELGAGQLATYLLDDGLRVHTELLLYDIVGKWLLHDTNRVDSLDRLLKCIRFCLIPEVQLQRLQGHWLTLHCPASRTHIDEGLKYHLDSMSGHPWLTESTKVRSTTPSLVMVHQGSAIRPFEITAYSHKEGKFYQLCQSSSGSRDCRVASVDNFVYICRVVDCGGGTLMNSLLRFDPRHLSLQELAPCRRLRIDPALVAKDKWLFVMGGMSENMDLVLDSVECYDINSNMWSELLPLPCPTHSHAATVCGQYIYVCGGVSGKEKVSTAAMWTYHPTNHVWQTKTPMLCARRLHEAAAVGGKVFVLGGIGMNHSFHQQTKIPIEGYDPATDQWTLLSSTIAGRSVGHYMEFEGKVLAIGRELYHAEEEDIWIYETDSDTWELQNKAPKKAGLARAMCSHLVINYSDKNVAERVMSERR